MYVLSILSGLHAGTEVEIDAFPLVLGGALDSDIILHDLKNISIGFDVGKHGNIIVDTNGFEVCFEDGTEIVEQNNAGLILAPVTFVLNNQVSIKFSSSEPQSLTHLKFARLFEKLPMRIPEPIVEMLASGSDRFSEFRVSDKSLPGFLVVLLVVCLAFLSTGDVLVDNNQDLAVSDTDLSNGNGVTVNSTANETHRFEAEGPSCRGCAPRAQAFLTHLIKEKRLDGVSVDVEGNILKVTGEIVALQKEAWREVQQQYDLNWSTKVPADSNVIEVDDAAPFEVRSVWLGEEPEFTTEEGAAFKIGDITEGGWRINDIGQSEVTLGRASTTLKIVF